MNNKKYYYANGSDKKGPFSLEEIKQQPITIDTLISYEGAEEWKPANEMEELTSHFSNENQVSSISLEKEDTPLVIPTQENVSSETDNTTQEKPPMPNNNLVKAILATIFCCLPFGIIAIINATKVNRLYFEGRYDEAQEKAEKAAKNIQTAFAIGLILGLIRFIIHITGIL